MTNYRRCRMPGGTYFFTVNLANRRQSLLTDHIQPLRDAFNEVLTAHPFTIQVIVVLPAHLHCLWELPEADSDYSTRWRQMTSAFSRALPRGERISATRTSKAERSIWQRRFWDHTIRDDAGFATRFDYIYYNPVKDCHVRQVTEWPYSSFTATCCVAITQAIWSAMGSRTWNWRKVRWESRCSTHLACSLVGGNQAHENRPPYFALAYIMTW